MKRVQRKGVKKLESQDDLAYLTGRRSSEEREKQIKSPAPRRTRQTRPRTERPDT